MTKFSNTYEGGSNGTAITTANSGGISGDAFTAATGVGFTNARASHGSLSAVVTAADGTQGNVRWALSSEAKVIMALDLYLGMQSTIDLDLMRFSVTGDVTAVTARINSAGKLRLTLPGSVFPWTATNVFPINQWVRVELYAENGTTTSDGKARLAYYLGDNTTAAEDSGLLTGLNTVASTAGATYVNARIGKLVNTTGFTATLGWDSSRVYTATDAVFPLGPLLTVNSPPTANAGADQTNVEPGTTVTLSGTDSDSDGTVTTRAWAQTVGTPTVTLSGTGASRTFTAPATIAGTTLTFTYTVTDNGGATGTSTTQVAVLPVTERAVIGGVEVPMQVRVT